MTLNKLKKIITIWLDEVVVNNKVIIRQVGSWKSGENNINRTYDIITDDNSLCGKHINIYIDTYTDINKNETFFTIGFDRKENEIKRCKHEVLTVFSDGRTQWFGDGSDPGDVAVAEHFSNDEIKKLKHMIGDVHEILQNLPEKHHDFDMDKAHAIHITEVTFKECDDIEIRFIANNRIFNSENKQMIPVIFDNSIDWLEDDEIYLPDTLPYIAGTTVMVCKYPMPANIKPKRLVVITQQGETHGLCDNLYIKPAIISTKTAEYFGMNQTDMIIVTETETDHNKKYEPMSTNKSVSELLSIFTDIDGNDADLDKIFGDVTKKHDIGNDCDKWKPDNQPKFINRPVPNPEYFKIGEAYHIRRFGYYSNIPGTDWVGILLNISGNCLTFACYIEHTKCLTHINVTFDDIGYGPIDIVRLSNVLSNNDEKRLDSFHDSPSKDQCINHHQTETNPIFNQKIIDHPRIEYSDLIKFGMILYENVCSENFGLSDTTRLMLTRALRLNDLPNTVEALLQLMVYYPDKNAFIKNIYGIGLKRMEEIINVFNVHGIQIEGYSDLD